PAVSTTLLATQSATPESDTLSLHDALPISDNWLKQQEWIGRFEKENPQADVYCVKSRVSKFKNAVEFPMDGVLANLPRSYVENSDRKSTRLNSSHVKISYAVFCLKKKIK